MECSASETGLYVAWEREALPGKHQGGTDEPSVVVLSRGERNHGAGPDYLGAVLIVDGRLRVGSVEMHTEVSDWFAHGHDSDRRYDSVILHVVARRGGSKAPDLPTITLKPADESDVAQWRHAGAITTELDHHDMVSPIAELHHRSTATLLAQLSWERLLGRVAVVISMDCSLVVADRVRRAFIRGLFDALGYGGSRQQMQRTADRLLEHEDALHRSTFDQIAVAVACASGMPPVRFADPAIGAVGYQRLKSIVDLSPAPFDTSWPDVGRPGNAPERRLWGGVVLLHAIYHNGLLNALAAAVAAGGVDAASRLLRVRLGRLPMIGADRAREIVVNALLPAMIAGGLVGGVSDVIASACHAWRSAPSLPDNMLIRRVEHRLLGGMRLRGAFWQQGAIEYAHRHTAIGSRPGMGRRVTELRGSYSARRSVCGANNNDRQL